MFESGPVIPEAVTLLVPLFKSFATISITKMCKFRTLRLVVVAADPVDPTDMCLDPANPERVWLCRT